ncbi:acyl-coa dehydrogenase [Holotrichia oblita]|uniref:Acyl-coa dehydrogenase n=3 Tax=Holotrichia oblita TaxID=644536 RepID=A0ACB9SQW9_HOLOL|nr:acyl-coa dehydrogenase [Holotrichia oblita]KAI4457595.1 acyl-coa dehydrogenase [Holotrichia oblita]KAI4457609.1 acyl-coa dehydrogenase [Holotrichia oblita]
MMTTSPNMSSSETGRLPLTTLTEDEQMMKETVSRLAKEQIAPVVREMEQLGYVKPDILKMLFENGLMGVEVSSDYGGAGCNFMTCIQVVEEISKVCPGVGALVDIHNTLVNPVIANYGNEEQKKKYLPLLSSSMVGSFCITEPSSGSDAFALKTVAKKDGSDYVINGSKMWISNSDLAGVFLVFANANPSAGYKGITCFIVDRDTPGFTVHKPENKLGIICSGTCMLSFDNVRVPASAMLGEFGQGYKISISVLNEGRIGIASQMLGCAQGCFDATIPYTLERQQFGQPIYNFQGMQHQIALVATQIEMARLLTYNAARTKEAGKPFIKEAAMAKYWASEVAQLATIKCIDWMGGVGFTKDFIQEKFYRDCKIGAIYEGTSNIQLNTIAKMVEKEYKNM